MNVWAEGEGGQAMLRICVSDTGIGIAADKLEGIFKPSHRPTIPHARISAARVSASRSRRLAQTLDGGLWAEGVRRGSRFLALPCSHWMRCRSCARSGRPDAMAWFADAAQPASALRDKTRSHFESSTYRAYAELEACPVQSFTSGLKVLLADDHASNRFIASSQIRRLGHGVTCAVTATEGDRALGPINSISSSWTPTCRAKAASSSPAGLLRCNPLANGIARSSR